MTGLPGGIAKPSFTCPCCGSVSHNPNDVAQGYCGRCCWWAGDPVLGPAHLADDCPQRKAATMTEIPADPAQAASEAVENWARTAPARPPGPFADLEWLLDAGLEVRIAPGSAGVAVTLFEGAGAVPVIEPVTVWPNAVVGAALAMARMIAEDAGYAQGGIRP